tara:strand:+ start:247 stop:432 length:186 start_codon:yes stop_codon:yes gene_type:complete
MFHYGYSVHAKIIIMSNNRKYTHEKLWSFADEHVIDGMIYSNDLGKWVTIEEYTDVYYGTL